MADSLRGRLIPLVLCCVSGGLAMQPQRAMADALPPLQVDPALLGPMPARTPPPARAGALTAGMPPLSLAAQAVSAAVQPTPSVLPLPELRPSARVTPIPANTPRPSFVAGKRIHTEDSDRTIVEGDAVLRRVGNTLTADRIVYRRNEDAVEAEGNVRLTTDANVVTGPKMERKFDAATGYFDKPVYVLKPQPAPGQAVPATTGYGHADHMDFEGENLYRLKAATYTTCTSDDPAWYARSSNLLLDYNRNEADGLKTTLYFKDVPFLYSPWLDFPLNNARRTGLLTPTLGTTSNTGLDISLPWYWNIAPNMDATLTPRYMGKRGDQLNTEFRYLEPFSSGSLHYEYMPKDAIFGGSRSSWSVVHNQNFGLGFSGALNMNGASDKSYFTDLASSISTTSLSYLTRQASLSYGSTWWNASVGTQHYTPLQDVAYTYDKMPYATLNASRPNFFGGTAFALNGDFANFSIHDPSNPNQAQGTRTVLYPQLSLPLVNSGFSLTPKIGYNLTRYNLSQVVTPGDPESITRKVPIVSVDSSVTFERDMTWGGKNLIQTLEPRLYYLRIPTVDQSKLPVFDTGIADFNFASIFSENRYSGNDRIGDANQLTAALTSRIINPETGVERIRGAIGQVYYFRNQTVTIPGEIARTSKQADFLAGLTGQFLPATYLDSAWQYNPRDKHTELFTIGTRWQPEPLKTFSVAYRFRRDSDVSLAAGTPDGLRDFDISGQWPLWGRWYGVARYNYSVHDKRLVDSVAGLEYDGGCWVGRLAMQRFIAASATTTIVSGPQNYTSALFIQLELNGFSRIGTDPVDLLKRSVAGYGKINEPRGAPLFGVE